MMTEAINYVKSQDQEIESEDTIQGESTSQPMLPAPQPESHPQYPGERVLAIRESPIREWLTKSNQVAVDRDSSEDLMIDIASRSTFIARDIAEESDEYLQIIPYAVLTFQNLVFTYNRGNDGGESRLANECSVGIGGHINPNDDAPHLSVGELIRNAMRREVQEEVGTEIARHVTLLTSEQFAGVIYDGTNDVGRRHMGIVFHIQLAAVLNPSTDSELGKSKLFVWMHSGFERMRMRVMPATYENWSILAMQLLPSLPS